MRNLVAYVVILILWFDSNFIKGDEYSKFHFRKISYSSDPTICMLEHYQVKKRFSPEYFLRVILVQKLHYVFWELPRFGSAAWEKNALSLGCTGVLLHRARRPYSYWSAG